MKKKGILSTCIILAIAIACAAIAGNSFYQKRHFVEDIVTEGTNVTEVFKNSSMMAVVEGWEAWFVMCQGHVCFF